MMGEDINQTHLGIAIRFLGRAFGSVFSTTNECGNY